MEIYSKLYFLHFLLVIVFVSNCKNGSTTTSTKNENLPPVINVEEEVKALLGESVSVSANTSDPNDDVLSFEWELLEKPVSSEVGKSLGSSSTLSFFPDLAGKYRVGLKVSDGEFEKKDTVAITTQYPLGPEINEKTILTNQYEYRVTEDLTINAPLIIEPNTKIYIESNEQVTHIETNYRGYISAKGTEDAPIVFSGLNHNPWAGILLSANEQTNVLKHVHIRDGINYLRDTTPDFVLNGILVVEGIASLQNTIIERSQKNDIEPPIEGSQTSLHIEESAQIEEFIQNSFDTNIEIALNNLQVLNNQFELEGDIVILPASSDSITLKNVGNKYIFDATFGGLNGVNITFDFNLEANVVLDLSEISNIIINESTTLSMEDGSSLIFSKNGSIDILGKIIAKGTETNPVSLISSNKQKGFWNGLRIFSSENKLDHTKVSHAGSTPNDPSLTRANIALYEGASLNISNSIIGESSGWGIWVSNDSELIESNNEFENCDLGTIGYE